MRALRFASLAARLAVIEARLSAAEATLAALGRSGGDKGRLRESFHEDQYPGG